MKKIFIPATLCALLTLTACGGEKKNDRAEADSLAAAARKEPMVADSDMQFSDTITRGDHFYEVSIHRFADKDLPTVKDELDQTFYDNCVRITIRRDGKDFFTKEFRKEAFADFISEAELANFILIGMNLDRSRTSSRRILLTARVGAQGSDTPRPFRVEIPTGGGAPSIMLDELLEPDIYDRTGPLR